MTSNFCTANGAAYSSKDITWTTPRDFYAQCDAEFRFGLDAAALSTSALCANWYGPDHQDPDKRNALTCNWTQDAQGKAIWLNPPYGRTIKQWMRKASQEAANGSTVVCLIPARTDTTWFHDYCITHEVRYIRGRLKFGDGRGSAPFPSALVVMKP